MVVITHPFWWRFATACFRVESTSISPPKMMSPNSSKSRTASMSKSHDLTIPSEVVRVWRGVLDLT